MGLSLLLGSFFQIFGIEFLRPAPARASMAYTTCRWLSVSARARRSNHTLTSSAQRPYWISQGARCGNGPARGEPDHLIAELIDTELADLMPQWGRLVESRITAPPRAGC